MNKVLISLIFMLCSFGVFAHAGTAHGHPEGENPGANKMKPITQEAHEREHQLMDAQKQETQSTNTDKPKEKPQR